MSRDGSRRRPRVEVKLGRRGRSLRIDGTFASYYEPGLPLTGSVWDALALPLVLLPPARRRSVLVLGLGGGSVARVVRALAPAACIVGVAGPLGGCAASGVYDPGSGSADALETVGPCDAASGVAVF